MCRLIIIFISLTGYYPAMKNILFLLLFVSCFCFGQNTYTVTEGELAFINPEEGIIIHKGNEYSKLEIKGDIDKGRMTFETTVSPMSLEIINRLKENPENIYSADLVSVNSRQLKKIRFTSNLEGEKNVISLLNNESFIDAEYSPDGVFDKADQIPYFYIKFGNRKIIKLFEGYDYFIIGSKTEITLYRFYKGLKKYKTEKTIAALSLDDIEHIQFSAYFDHYYRVDTIGRKVALRNYFNERVLPAKYDSVIASRDFLTAYTNKKIELYNPILKQLDLKGLKAVKQMRHFPVVYILQKNEQKIINVLGLEEHILRSTILYGSSVLPSRYPATFSQEGDEFYITSPGIELFKPELIWNGEKRKLYNTQNLDSIYIWNNQIEMDFFNGISNTTICVCRMDSGKYKLEYLADFLYEHPEVLPEEYDKGTILNHLDFVEAHSSYLKFVKNGLIGYYPYNKTAKYKEIEEYRGFENFIRFTLPDGRKGWLDTNGKEYLDE